MTRPNLATIMRRAHEIARTLEGDYRARLAYGMRAAWTEARGRRMEETMTKTITPVDYREWLAANGKNPDYEGNLAWLQAMENLTGMSRVAIEDWRRQQGQKKAIAEGLATGDVVIKKTANGKLVAEGPCNLAGVGATIGGYKVVALGSAFRVYPKGRRNGWEGRQYYYLDAPVASPTSRPAALSIDEIGDLNDTPINDNTPYHKGDDYAE